MKRRDFLKVPALGVALPAAAGFERMNPWRESGESPAPQPEDQAKFEQRLHQDFVTFVPGIEYFFLGNGEIQAVLQYCPDRSAERPQTFLALTIVHPEHFGRKWSSYLYHSEQGFTRTALNVSVDGVNGTATPGSLSTINWVYPDGIPTVNARWKSGVCDVEEHFYTPSAGPLLFRTVRVRNTGVSPVNIRLSLALYPNFGLFDEIGTDDTTGTVRALGFATMTLQCLDGKVAVTDRYYMTVVAGTLAPGEERRVRFVYSIAEKPGLISPARHDALVRGTRKYWMTTTTIRTGQETLDHLCAVSRTGLRTLLARSGKRDSGFWMYNMEWVRDDVMMSVAMLQAGMATEAKTLLVKILEKSIGPDGRTIESSRWFGFDFTELDQNGQLLYGVWAYACWTGDLSLVKKYWKKIALTAEFPLQDVFRDKESGLMRNKREFWERRDFFGVEDGYELAYQFWVALGLGKAADLADAIGAKEGKRWRDTSAAIRSSMLSHPKFSLVEEGHFIKRRTRDGRWQQVMIPPDRTRMPPGSPIATEEKPACEPDSGSVLPIVFGMVAPDSDVALGTLRHCEELWNQRWTSGGYSRYNVASEPDPPGPWPLASLFIARAYVETGDADKVWRVLNWLRTVHGGLSGGWFERYGPSITPPAPPVSVVSWTWAEVTMLAIQHLAGVHPGLTNLVIRPRLIKGLDGLSGSFRVRGHEVKLSVRRGAGEMTAEVNGARTPVRDGAVTLDYPSKPATITVTMTIPST